MLFQRLEGIGYNFLSEHRLATQSVAKIERRRAEAQKTLEDMRGGRDEARYSRLGPAIAEEMRNTRLKMLERMPSPSLTTCCNLILRVHHFANRVQHVRDTRNGII